MEYLAPSSYCARPPMEPWHAFVIDATAGAMRTGATASVCAAVRAAVEALAAEPRARVAVMTFDDRIQFYTVAGGAPRMMVVSDIQVRPPAVALFHVGRWLCPVGALLMRRDAPRCRSGLVRL